MNQRRRDLYDLVRALAMRPGDVPKYIRDSILSKKTATERGLPWFSYGAIDYLEGNLTGGEVVYEFGSGGSTLWFADRVRRVVSIENDEQWLSRVCKALNAKAARNSELVYAEADFTNPETFAESDFANALPVGGADIIVVDSYDYQPPHPLRPILFRKAEERINPGGIIIVDDSWRYPTLRETTRAKTVHTVSGVGPARHATTSTDFFQY